jgi:hypothetical protein
MAFPFGRYLLAVIIKNSAGSLHRKGGGSRTRRCPRRLLEDTGIYKPEELVRVGRQPMKLAICAIGTKRTFQRGQRWILARNGYRVPSLFLSRQMSHMWRSRRLMSAFEG